MSNPTTVNDNNQSNIGLVAAPPLPNIDKNDEYYKMGYRDGLNELGDNTHNVSKYNRREYIAGWKDGNSDRKKKNTPAPGAPKGGKTRKHSKKSKKTMKKKSRKHRK